VYVRQLCRSRSPGVCGTPWRAKYSGVAQGRGAGRYLLKQSAGAEVVEAVRAVHAHGAYLSQKIAGSVIADYTREQAPESPLDALTRSERQILQLIVAGKSNLEASRSLLSQSPPADRLGQLIDELNTHLLSPPHA
jgi:hypothetical protein